MEPRSRRIQGRAFRVASAGVLALAMTAMAPTPGTASAQDCPAPSQESMCATPGNASIEVTQPVEMGGGFGESACPGGCEG